jgi:hypothetical protein
MTGVGKCHLCGGPVMLAAAMFDPQGVRHINCQAGSARVWSWPRHPSVREVFTTKAGADVLNPKNAEDSAND